MLRGVAVLLLITFCAVFADAESGATSIELQYASGVSPESRAEISSDIELFKKMNWSEPTGELSRLTLQPSGSPMPLQQQLELFLAERMHYVLDINHSIDSSVITTTPLNELVEPQIGEDEADGDEHENNNDYYDEPSSNQAGTVMVNVGTMVYISGIKNKNIQSFNISGIGPVPVKSPRVGIFKIGPGFFSPVFKEAIDDSLFLHQAFRLATMFHESRHTDGNASSLGFLHSICPEGHPYQGLAACDTPSNGPYRMGALILSSIENNCKKCSGGMKDALEILRNDSLSRIQSRIPGPQPLLTKEQKKICANNIFRAGGDGEDICGGDSNSPENKVIEWDSRPEGLK